MMWRISFKIGPNYSWTKIYKNWTICGGIGAKASSASEWDVWKDEEMRVRTSKTFGLPVEM